MRPRLISALVVIILFVVFLMQNTQVVTLRIYFWKISMSQIILIPLVLIVGFALGYIAAKVTRKKETPKKESSSNT